MVAARRPDQGAAVKLFGRRSGDDHSADEERPATTIFGSLPPSPPPTGSRTIRVLPIAVLVGALGLGTVAGVVFHRAGDVTASPPSGTATTTNPASSSTPSARPSGESATPARPTGTPSSTTPSTLPRSAPVDGGQFVVPRGPAEAQQLDVAWVNGPTVTTRLKTPKGHRVNSPTLSVDRRTIIYIDRTAGRLRTMAADGSGDRVLFRDHPSGCDTLGHVSWNRADQNQLVLRCTDVAGRPALFVVTVAGDLVRRLDLGDVRLDDPAISPDGTRVAFWMATTTRRANGGGIVSMPLDGSAAPTWLTPDRIGRDADPAWSPDGTRIAFRRSTVNSGFDVYVMAADGSGVRRVLGGPATEEKPAWSPDSSRLLAVSDRDDPGKVQTLYLVTATGDKPKPVGLGAEVVTTPVWASR